MSTPRDPSERLTELERILSQSRPGIAGRDEDAGSAAAYLTAVPADRICQLTATLQRALDHAIDEVDAVTIRLLLHDYTIGVAQLRAIARMAADRIDGATDRIRESQRFVHRDELDERKAAERRQGVSQS